MIDTIYIYNFIMIDILNSCSSSMSEDNTLFESGFSMSRLLAEMRRDFSLDQWYSSMTPRFPGAQVGILGVAGKPSFGVAVPCPIEFAGWLFYINVFYFHPYLGKIPILTSISPPVR